MTPERDAGEADVCPEEGSLLMPQREQSILMPHGAPQAIVDPDWKSCCDLF